MLLLKREAPTSIYKWWDQVTIDKYKVKAETGISLIHFFDKNKVKVREPNIISINTNNQFTMVILIENSVFEEARQLLNDYRNKSFIEIVK